jgi:hypothetical protein
MTINHEKQKNLTHEQLTTLLDYHAERGIFYWKVSRRGHARAGDRAGRIVKGYRSIKINGIVYYEHRLAWFYVTKQWPVDQIDHEDLNKSNNRFSNLREASQSQNTFNRTRLRTRNKSGFKGVSWCRFEQKWRAVISAHGTYFALGYFNTPKEAYAAWCRSAQKLHGSFAHIERPL